MDQTIYQERIRSPRTTLLFILLSGLFLVFAGWRWAAVGFKFTAGLFIFLALTFLFYVFNYRTLTIFISNQSIKLEFGLARWETKLGNIQEAYLDDSPLVIQFGGAGVHFAFVGGEYRAFYNFLEFPRVLLRFKDRQGLVQGLVFTTRQPEQVLEVINGRLEAE